MRPPYLQVNRPQADDEVLAEINTTPLIDVMLVLLIMLIITIPIQLHGVNLNLPAGAPSPQKPPEAIRIAIDAVGVVHWNGEALADLGGLEARLHRAAVQPAPPELRLQPSARAPYRSVAAVMSAIQREGLTKVALDGAE